MLVNANLVGRLVGVTGPGCKDYVQVIAKCVAQDNDTFTVEYAAGNTDIVEKRRVGVAAAWLVEEWRRLIAMPAVQ